MVHFPRSLGHLLVRAEITGEEARLRMAYLDLGPEDQLYFEHEKPEDSGHTFVFVNALTGDTSQWQAEIGPKLRESGHGTLCYNLRGQAKSNLAATTKLTADSIVEDLNLLLDHVAPARPILVGLSIGGLFAAQAEIAAPRAEGLVLINTLRKPTLRLEWINRAMVEMAKFGGTRLVMAANVPMLVNPDFLPKLWEAAFSDDPFTGMASAVPLMRLMEASRGADWDLRYEKLALPTLVMTGDYDRVFRIEADVEELTARLPNAKSIRYPDAGHLIPLERPAAFSQHLLEFAASL